MSEFIVKLKTLLRPIAILVLCIVLLILLVGAGAKLAQKIRGANLVSSLFSAISLSSERIVVSANPSAVSSGKPFVISWTHEKQHEDGSYELTYPCRPNFDLTLDSKESIPCNAAFPVTGKTSLAIIPILDADTSVDMPVSITFTPNGAFRAALSGSAIVTVSPKDQASTDGNHTQGSGTTTSPSPTSSSSNEGGSGTLTPGPKTEKIFPTGSRIDPNGVPDLAIEIVDSGILLNAGSSTETFVPKGVLSANDRAAVVFDVKNIGTNVSGAWHFTASLPIAGGDFTSDTEAPLAPGDKIRFTIGFDNIPIGSSVAKFTVDPQNEVSRDIHRTNNSVSITLVRGN